MTKPLSHDNRSRACRNLRAPLYGRVIGSGPLVQFIHRIVVILVGFVSFGGVTQARAAPFDLAGNDWEGCADLVRLARTELGADRVITTQQIDFHELKPDDGLLLLHPERTLDVDALAKFMRAGGRVVMLDDFGRGDSLLRHFGMDRVASPRHPAELLRHNPQLALAEPASAHPVVTDVSRVVTNHPTGLSHPDLSPVLKIRATGEADVVVAVAGAVGQGRLLAVGDPSILMNSMLRYAGNKSFGRGLVRYAVDHDSWGKRGGRLFISAGAFEQKGTFGESSAWGETVRNVREALEAARRDGFSSTIMYAAAIAVWLALSLWIALRAGRLHKPVTPRFVGPIPVLSQGGVVGQAAVLAAPETSRALAVLELKGALEEQLTALLGLSKVPGQEELLAQVTRRKLLPSEGVHALRQLLLRMSTVETMIVSAHNGGTVVPIDDSEVVRISRHIDDLVARANEHASHAAHAEGPNG